MDPFSSKLLSISSRQEALEFIRSETARSVVPEFSSLPGCSQGSDIHLEGDVAVHTSIVVENIHGMAPQRKGSSADIVDLTAAILHDVCKPATRRAGENGSVSFPGHERLAVPIAERVADFLGFSMFDKERLTFAIMYHGDAHSWPELSDCERNKLRNEPGFLLLACLQEADAFGCYLPNGKTLPSYFDQMMMFSSLGFPS